MSLKGLPQKGASVVSSIAFHPLPQARLGGVRSAVQVHIRTLRHRYAELGIIKALGIVDSKALGIVDSTPSVCRAR